jgi:polyvinyl alcohol dehydrogenase (cytochrome)
VSMTTQMPMHLRSHHVRNLLIASATIFLILLLVAGSIALTVRGATGQTTLTQYLVNDAHSSFNSAETLLTRANVASLTQKWLTGGETRITVQPIVVNGVVYWGSANGIVHAASVSTGAFVWRDALGSTSADTCGGPAWGIAGAAAYTTINGVGAIIIAGGGNVAPGDGHYYLYALNAQSGAQIWKTAIGTAASGDFPWSSPDVYNSSVYYSIASLDDCPLSRGRIDKVNATTGALTGTFYTTPAACLGSGIWSTPSIDDTTGMLYATTGNSPCLGQTGDYSESIVEVNTTTMVAVTSWQVPAAQRVADSDFGTTATLFTATINSVVTPMLGAGNKNGWYYALNRTNIAAGPVWEDQVAIGGPGPTAGQGTVSSSAFNGPALYVAGGNTTIGDVSCTGSLRQINPATGQFWWQDCLAAVPLGAVTMTPGVVYLNYGTSLGIFNSATGATLLTFSDPLAAHLWGVAAPVNGQVFDGDTKGTLYALGL